jgi:hypothetical protein
VKTEQRDQENKPNTDLQTITLLVDPPAAERMALAMHEGKIHLTLRNREVADTAATTAAIDTRQLLGGTSPTPSAGPRRYSAPKEKIVYRDNPTVAAPPPAQPYKVTVIKKSKTETTETAQDKK